MRWRDGFVVLGTALLAATAWSADLLNLNRATKEQLLGLGLTESQAIQVVNYRQKTGPLLQVEELQVVPQISKDTFAKIRDKVTVDE